ncbi:Protein of unknown function [Loktanella atrilutea]|uniref:Adenylate cyclase n=1 Tax=Loktanella atrilutea TaxID=366533 RepID=A0A1M5C9U9_LOKAT|nr:DUF3095 domain-containing protein [Loktanella atrilutea]SHF51505.1 Protein of unknown function [Loktanella atrilutea]
MSGEATRRSRPIDNASFYTALPLIDAFESLSDTANFSALPDDWLIGVSDIEGSTAEIAKGRYKAVNMVGAAVISAQLNAARGAAFPFVFGGDGATFAIWPAQAQAAEASLRAVQRWALDEYGIVLRAALVPVRDILDAGLRIAVARYRVSDGVDYAMFHGGGASWAERALKDGAYGLAPAPPGVRPDLSGLSCRWAPQTARNDMILSLVVVPVPGASPRQFAQVAAEVVSLAQALDRGGHPVPRDGPAMQWPPEGLALEARAQRGSGSLRRQRIGILFQSFLALVLTRTGWKVGGFDARHHNRIVAANSDFRKWDDGLKMTLDCDTETLVRIEALLSDYHSRGILRYGLHRQDSAIMTCIVPSILRDDHVHFVDGADGGYTAAAAAMKAQG